MKRLDYFECRSTGLSSCDRPCVRRASRRRTSPIAGAAAGREFSPDEEVPPLISRAAAHLGRKPIYLPQVLGLTPAPPSARRILCALGS